jgi:FdhD protein
VRHRTADSSCGLCGVESLEQALRPLPAGLPQWTGSDDAVFAALQALETAQPLGASTRAVHAAAACNVDGGIRLVREDVGRHNAFDKLIGAMLRGGFGWEGGFALLTSRCSYELVEKAVLSNCPMLATISAPTTLALARARSAGLALSVLARPDSLLRPAG